MRDHPPTLSPNSVSILEMIAAGSSYEDILENQPDLCYSDIYQAAEEVLDAVFGHARRERYSRTCQPWNDRDDSALRDLIRAGSSVAHIAGRLHRNREAIRNRIVELRLVGELVPREQVRLRRMYRREHRS